MKNCLNCGKETNNPKFCSRSCSASVTNREYVKRKFSGVKCKTCDSIIMIVRRTVCDSCLDKKNDRTLFDISRRKEPYTSRFAGVRTNAKIAARELDQRCHICGYSKHVEVCHIKPVSEFSLDSKLSEVNDVSNLIMLCPNHHWEFDNGMLFA